MRSPSAILVWMLVAAMLGLIVAASVRADERCWIQPGEAPAAGWALAVAGIPVPIVPVNHGPDVALDGTVGDRWCAETPAHGVYQWSLAALAEDGTRVEGVNSPLVRWGPPACRADFNGDGGVGMGDVSDVLGLLGGGCGP